MTGTPVVHDMLVVGSGIVGGAVAVALADAGVDTAVVTDLPARSRQASRAAGAMLGVFSEVSSTESPARRDLHVAERVRARRLYDGWVADLSERSGVAVGIVPGLFVIGNNDGEDDEAGLAAIADAASAWESPAEPVSWRDVPGLQPEPAARPFRVLHLAAEGSVDTGLLLGALDGVLERHPRTEIVPGRVAGLEPGAGEDITVRLTSGAERRARRVVLAGGAETTGLLLASPDLETGLPPVLAGRGVSALLRSPIPLPAAIRTPNRGFACGTHLVPRAGSVYLGATNRLSTGPPAERQATLDEIAALVNSGVREIHTGLRQAELVSVSTGYRPVTVDSLPLVGRTLDPRVLVATATYRNGILLAPRVAELLAREVIEPGSGSEHPYSARREIKVPAGAEWLPAGAGRSLVAHLTSPDRRLAPGRARELEQFLQLAIAMLLDGDAPDRGLRRKLSRLGQRAPLEEAVPLVFEATVRHLEQSGP